MAQSAGGHGARRPPQAPAPTRPGPAADEDKSLRPLPDQVPAIGEGTVPVFLTLLFAILPLWAIWYFLTHLAPLLAIEPPSMRRDAPQEVRAYRAAEATPSDARLAQLARGGAIYAERCALCHGPDGGGQPAGQPYLQAKALRGDPLLHALTLPQLVDLIDGGFPGAMPAWRDELGRQQIVDVATYVQQVLGSEPPPSPTPAVSSTASPAPASGTTPSATGAGAPSGPAGQPPAR